ncbi:hypothetical protein DQ238_02555 [Geodermatophilus sp. TF02-6]|uniref:hypothetical protein n=1 Tax=Geodermatophilus sp. TF02-6 TaxID=2250575 RepID=UPI000DE8D486|nr:hypothetical protein [Geodermatophilus sp. TF02-6]RBY82906.1 hypothetical protein DQ238_02555 [Geodermatophilus sp. TF02-6]
MGWAIGSAVGFVLLTTLVIGLARNSTARWERDRCATRIPDPPPEPASPSVRRRTGVAHRGPRTVRRLPRPHVHLPHLPHPHLPHPHPRLPHLPRHRQQPDPALHAQAPETPTDASAS